MRHPGFRAVMMLPVFHESDAVVVEIGLAVAVFLPRRLWCHSVATGAALEDPFQRMNVVVFELEVGQRPGRNGAAVR